MSSYPIEADRGGEFYDAYIDALATALIDHLPLIDPINACFEESFATTQ